MKPRLSTNRETAMTLFEVGVVVAVVLILAAVLLPMLRQPQRKSSKIGCVNNLKQLGLAYRIWEGDNGDIYPMGISVTNGGSMEMVQSGNVVITFQVMSNELSTPKILYCPSDTARFSTTYFSGLANSNVSYFVGVDVTNELNPQAILSGDSHFEISRVAVKLVSFPSRQTTRWLGLQHVTSVVAIWVLVTAAFNRRVRPASERTLA